MNYDGALKYLYSLPGGESKGKFDLSLLKIRKLCRELGNPERSLRVVHVAGTNGKGSVSSMAASMLAASGLKVGLYLSPHVFDFRERYSLNGTLISKKEVGGMVSAIRNVRTNESFFEVITAMAFLWFKEEGVDVAVLETGLGGRFDATNVIDPVVSVITNIGLEHTRHLGKTLKKIAFEKAGIIKKGRPVVTSAAGEALQVIRRVAKKRGAKVIVVRQAWKGPVGLRGSFQKMNAAMAVEAVRLCGFAVSKNSIERGLRKASIPGRFTFVEKNVLVDVAHNADGMAILRKEILKIKKNYGKIILVIGILKDKAVEDMLSIILSVADTTIFTTVPIPRGEDPKTLRGEREGVVLPNPKKALAYAKKIAGKKDLIVVTGSIYLAGALK